LHACIGATLGGRYLVKHLLGEGGMGCVYEGEHVGLGRGVAIKIMHANYSANRDVVERFRREAQSASALENEHVVDVLDVDTDERFGLYMVMELLRGEDLSNTLKELGAFPARVACGVIAQCAAALACAHAAGIVHRDLKPANLFLVQKPDGSALLKLLDFSVAKIANVDNAQSQITRAGSALGTPQYMAPEQAQGTQIDHRADIYALGAVLYELLVGKPARSPKPSYALMIVDVITQPAPRPRELLPDLPKALDNLVARMMSQDPNRRPKDMDEVLGALLELYPDLATTRLMLAVEGNAPRITLDSAGAGADLFSRAVRSTDHLRAVSRPPASNFGSASIATPHELVAPAFPSVTNRQRYFGILILLGLIALGAGAAATWILSSQSNEDEPITTKTGVTLIPANEPVPTFVVSDPGPNSDSVTNPAPPEAPEDGTAKEPAQEAAPSATEPQEKGKADAPTKGGKRAPPRQKKEPQVGGTGVEENF
jgi:eukaryotic-like serine/threonine-protein kinase